jgi:3'(2'), 5'-bisphosphate nucleotidase
MVSKNLLKYIPDFHKLCRRVGDIQLKGQNDLNINLKSDNSPVTNIDLHSNEIITNYLSTTFVNDVIISEENLNQQVHHKSYWLVDPIDGTKNYISGGKNFCICVSYIVSGYPVFGIIYIPATKEFYYASKDNGAFIIKQGVEAQRILSNGETKNNIYVSTVIRKSVVNILKKYFNSSELVSMSSAIKFTRIAESKGHFSIRLGPTHEWDTAAGQCIVEECGGLFLDRNLNRFSYGHDDKFLNGPFFIINGNLDSHKNCIKECLSLI